MVTTGDGHNDRGGSPHLDGSTHPGGNGSSGTTAGGTKPATVRIAAVGDVHCAADGRGTLKPLFQRIAAAADVLVLCGDLTDYGLPEEAHVLAGELAAAKLPTLAVMGNHEFHSNQQDEVRKVLEGQAGVTFIDGDAKEVCGIGFAGAKGFGGGFGRGTLGAWGEPAVKAFVQEAIDEAMKLEAALARLRTPRRIAVLHYAPIKATVEGEPVEIFPWLGCSRLEEPINRYPVAAVVHGHAHNGTPEGRTGGGVPVYNVALPLMRKSYPDHPPFRLLEVPVNPDAPADARGGPSATQAAADDAALGHAPVQTTVR
ncbi:MAG: Metallophosphoesterase [Phycisphaerales bacterium]|nr:Metallophosphoesterase [Phycisphaerales bacterium]